MPTWTRPSSWPRIPSMGDMSWRAAASPWRTSRRGTGLFPAAFYFEREAAPASGPGGVLAGPPSRAQDGAPAGRLRGAAFPHAILESPAGMSGGRVNELAQGIAEFFADSLRGERIEAAWPCIFAGAQDIAGLGRRVAAVEAASHGILKKNIGRIARLASAQKPRVG